MKGRHNSILQLVVAFSLGVLSAVFLPDIVIIVLLTAMLLVVGLCLLR